VYYDIAVVIFTFSFSTLCLLRCGFQLSSVLRLNRALTMNEADFWPELHTAKIKKGAG
jgi:hypothetical protein